MKSRNPSCPHTRHSDREDSCHVEMKTSNSSHPLTSLFFTTYEMNCDLIYSLSMEKSSAFIFNWIQMWTMLLQWNSTLLCLSNSSLKTNIFPFYILQTTNHQEASLSLKFENGDSSPNLFTLVCIAVPYVLILKQGTFNHYQIVGKQFSMCLSVSVSECPASLWPSVNWADKWQGPAASMQHTTLQWIRGTLTKISSWWSLKWLILIASCQQFSRPVPQNPANNSL